MALQISNIIVLLLLLLTGCQSVQLTGNTVDCKEVVSCSREGCIKQYRGGDCSPEMKTNNERKFLF